MNYEYLNWVTNPAYYVPILIGLSTYVTLWILKNVVIARIQRISTRTDTYLKEVILVTLEKTNHLFILLTSLYVGFYASPLLKDYGHWVNKLYISVASIQLIIWGLQAITSWFEFAIKKKNNDPSVKTSFGFISLLFKLIYIVGVLLFALNNIGVNVSTFVAGLGVGGIAIALATQNILGDLFSSLSIVMDKPFIVGDFISLGDWKGTIEHIGLKTTRIRSLSGEQIIISNSDLLSSKIRNFKRMAERRSVFQLGVTYQTKREDLKRAPAIIEEIIRKEEKARFDRAHFVAYGASSLDIEVVYWVLSPDYKEFADIHQRVLLSIHEAFEVNNLSFAYPTQTLFIEKMNTAN
jgi:small-conductance mechanosensitive channel